VAVPKSKKYSIGIDLGGTKILAALFDEKFRRQSEIKFKTKPEKGLNFLLRTLQKSVKDLLKEAEVKPAQIAGIGVGCPGIIDVKRGVVITSPNIGFLKNYPLGPKLSRLTGLPVVLGNDVKTGLYGEHQFGAAKGFSNVIGIFIGTGIGGALILNNEIYMGASGGAGEIGHMLVDPIGSFCGCGRRGCLEAMAGRVAIASEAAALAAKQQAPSIWKETEARVPAIKSSVLAKSVKARERSIEIMLKAKARLVGQIMADLVNVFNPAMIVLGGGLVEALPELIVREAERQMRLEAMPILAKTVKVVPARLKDHSVSMGAAKRAWDRYGDDKVKSTE